MPFDCDFRRTFIASKRQGISIEIDATIVTICPTLGRSKRHEDKRYPIKIVVMVHWGGVRWTNAMRFDVERTKKGARCSDVLFFIRRRHYPACVSLPSSWTRWLLALLFWWGSERQDITKLIKNGFPFNKRGTLRTVSPPSTINCINYLELRSLASVTKQWVGAIGNRLGNVLLNTWLWNLLAGDCATFCETLLLPL